MSLQITLTAQYTSCVEMSKFFFIDLFFAENCFRKYSVAFDISLSLRDNLQKKDHALSYEHVSK